MKTKIAATIVLMMFSFCALSSVAHAQATRTWVSGVGDDANPCSRTAPCKTFAGAISKTATGGEIDVLDPGGFGALTITKSISIEAEGVIAGVLVSGTNGIVVNTPSGSLVTLRGLTIEGLGTGLTGISFTQAGTLHIEHCYINHFTQNGIAFTPTAPGQLFVSDTITQNNTLNGVFVAPSSFPGTTAAVTITTTLSKNNQNTGMIFEDGTTATVTNSAASSNTFNGFTTISNVSAVSMTVENSTADNNGSHGIRSDGTDSTVYIAGDTVTGNAIGLNASGGALVSFGNNYVTGNTPSDGAPTSTVSPI